MCNKSKLGVIWVQRKEIISGQAQVEGVQGESEGVEVV